MVTRSVSEEMSDVKSLARASGCEGNHPVLFQLEDYECYRVECGAVQLERFQKFRRSGLVLAFGRSHLNDQNALVIDTATA